MQLYQKYLKRYWIPFFMAIFCVACEAFCDLLCPTLMARIINAGISEGKLDNVLYWGVRMLAVTVIGGGFAMARNILASQVSQRMGADLRYDLFKKILGVSEAGADAIETGSLITRMTNDTSQVMQFVNGIMRIFFKAPITCVGSIILATIINFRLSVIIYAVVAVIAVILVLSMKWSYPRFASLQKAADRMNSVLQEYLSGIRLVKAFGTYDQEAERFSGANDTLYEKGVSSQTIITFASPIITLSVGIGVALAIHYGSRLFINNEIMPGDISAFTIYMTQMLNSLLMLTSIFNTFVRTKASTTRISEVFALEDDYGAGETRERQGERERQGALRTPALSPRCTADCGALCRAEPSPSLHPPPAALGSDSYEPPPKGQRPFGNPASALRAGEGMEGEGQLASTKPISLLSPSSLAVRQKKGFQRDTVPLAGVQGTESPGIPPVDSPGVPSSPPVGIRFDHVTFVYPNGSGVPAIDDLTFSTEPGESLAIIGPTGSGKSTICWLLLRFYDVSGGTIHLDDQDIRSLPVETVRKRVAIVPQKPMLFSGTVEENIRWGNPGAADHAVHRAAEKAQADFVWRMPDGFSSMLGSGAVNLSGGQKQRLSIARGLIREAPILLLDDATSALDALTEAKVRENLQENHGRQTVVTITQRCTTAMFSDKILVIENGRAVGFGNHASLLKSCESYSEIYRSQVDSQMEG